MELDEKKLDHAILVNAIKDAEVLISEAEKKGFEWIAIHDDIIDRLRLNNVFDEFINVFVSKGYVLKQNEWPYVDGIVILFKGKGVLR